jgi:hypothetical protein
MSNLPAPEVMAAETVEDLQAALDEFSPIASSLEHARMPFEPPQWKSVARRAAFLATSSRGRVPVRSLLASGFEPGPAARLADMKAGNMAGSIRPAEERGSIDYKCQWVEAILRRRANTADVAVSLAAKSNRVQDGFKSTPGTTV